MTKVTKYTVRCGSRLVKEATSLFFLRNTDAFVPSHQKRDGFIDGHDQHDNSHNQNGKCVIIGLAEGKSSDRRHLLLHFEQLPRRQTIHITDYDHQDIGEGKHDSPEPSGHLFHDKLQHRMPVLPVHRAPRDTWSRSSLLSHIHRLRDRKSVV